MKRNTTVNHIVLRILAHGPVHFLVAETEHQCLITNQCLIMGLRIADYLFHRSSGGQLMPELPHIPILIVVLLQVTDPQIRISHCQTVIEADSSLFDRNTHTRHTGHILCNRQSLRIQLMNQVICQRQIRDCLDICIHGKILIVAVKTGSKAVIQIQHAGHAVKTEAIEMIFIHPELQIRKQEMENLILSIVKQLGIPCAVISSLSCMEELIVRSVKLIDSFPGVLGRVGMNDIQQNTDAHAVRLIYQVLQIGRKTASGRNCKEIRNLISEGTIICMLHNRHHLNRIVTKLLNPRQNIIGKLAVCTNASLFLRHADMTLINIRRQLTAEVLISPRICLLFIINLSVPLNCLTVLHNPTAVKRNPVQLPAFMNHNCKNTASVPQRVSSFQNQLKYAAFQFLHRM